MCRLSLATTRCCSRTTAYEMLKIPLTSLKTHIKRNMLKWCGPCLSLLSDFYLESSKIKCCSRSISPVLWHICHIRVGDAIFPLIQNCRIISEGSSIMWSEEYSNTFRAFLIIKQCSWNQISVSRNYNIMMCPSICRLSELMRIHLPSHTIILVSWKEK